jgi:hypothetical protein
MNDPLLPANVGPLIQQVHRTLPLVKFGFGILACLAGSVAVCVALFNATGTSEKLKEAKTAKGRVVKMVSGIGGSGASRQRGSAPVVEFEVDGQTHQIQGKVFTHPPAFKTGDVIDVSYPPNNPADGVIDSFAERWFMPTVFGGVGSVFLIVGLVLILKHIWQRTAAVSAPALNPTT